MKTWHYSYSITDSGDRYGTLYVEDEPWWLAFSYHCLSRWLGILIAVTSSIPMPNWFPREYTKHRPGKFTLREWYGNVGNFIEVRWRLRLLERRLGHPKHKRYNIRVNYDVLKGVFHESNPSFFREDETGMSEFLKVRNGSTA